jgi:hypothetical protein
MAERDVNEAAADVIRHTLAQHEKPLPPDVEEAWRFWSASIQNVDERGMTLLRAAFEAGVEAAQKTRLSNN